MIIDPSLALQAAIYTVLTTNTDVANACPHGVNVFDEVPQNPPYPFMSIGDDEITPGQIYENSATTEAHVMVHVWSQAVGRPEVKRLAAAVHAALSARIPITGFRTMSFTPCQTRSIPSLDGLTQHSVVEFDYVISAV